MKKLFLLSLVILALLLVACGSNNPPAVELDFEPVIEGTVLKLSGTTNLPDGAIIVWDISPGPNYQGQFEFDMVKEGTAKVENGKWQASISLENMPKGEIEIWVGFQTIMRESEKQPPQIIEMYGEMGERITGPLAQKSGYITRAELTKTITY